MNSATFHSLASVNLGTWQRPEASPVPSDRPEPSSRARPILAALLVGASSALLVGGCVVAALVGGAWGFTATMTGFAAYLVVFSRALDHLPFDWNAWRERNFDEAPPRETGNGEETSQGGDR